jgi:hypothetical protein
MPNKAETGHIFVPPYSNLNGNVSERPPRTDTFGHIQHEHFELNGLGSKGTHIDMCKRLATAGGYHEAEVLSEVIANLNNFDTAAAYFHNSLEGVLWISKISNEWGIIINPGLHNRGGNPLVLVATLLEHMRHKACQNAHLPGVLEELNQQMSAWTAKQA